MAEAAFQGDYTLFRLIGEALNFEGKSVFPVMYRIKRNKAA